MAGRPRCPDCDEGLFERNGKCGKCHGTGINTQLNSAQPECPFCAGTGICSTCGGSGLLGDGIDTIQRLFT